MEVLEDTGYPADGAEVFVAGNGGGAMSELVSNAYNVVLVDHSVQRVDGLRLAALIRSTPAISSIPIVLFVEAGDQLSLLEGRRVGADWVFEKPVDAGQLAGALDDIIAGSDGASS